MRGGNALLFDDLNPGMLPLLRDGRHGTLLFLILTNQGSYFGTIPKSYQSHCITNVKDRYNFNDLFTIIFNLVVAVKPAMLCAL